MVVPAVTATPRKSLPVSVTVVAEWSVAPSSSALPVSDAVA